MSRVHYQPDNKVIDEQELFESTRTVSIPIDPDDRYSEGCRYQIFFGIPKDGAVIDSLTVRDTYWTENSTNDTLTHSHYLFNDYFFDEASQTWQLSIQMSGYKANRDGEGNSGNRMEYEFSGQVSPQQYDGIDRITILNTHNDSTYAAYAFLSYATSAIAQPFRTITFSFKYGNEIRHNIRYAAEIGYRFGKSGDGFNGLSVDGEYRFFDLFYKDHYLLCDVSGNVIEPPFDPYLDSNEDVKWCHQMHTSPLINGVSVELMPNDAEPLSADQRFMWMF